LYFSLILASMEGLRLSCNSYMLNATQVSVRNKRVCFPLIVDAGNYEIKNQLFDQL
jgi:hypothetical protein